MFPNREHSSRRGLQQLQVEGCIYFNGWYKERLAFGEYRSCTIEFRNFTIAHFNGLLMSLDGGA